jgi:hypothetical protein
MEGGQKSHKPLGRLIFPGNDDPRPERWASITPNSFLIFAINLNEAIGGKWISDRTELFPKGGFTSIVVIVHDAVAIKPMVAMSMIQWKTTILRHITGGKNDG